MTTDQQLLREAVFEIKQLRKQNEIMSARLDMFDKCMLIFQSAPAYQSQGMSPDLVWQIEKHLTENIEKD